MTTVGLHGKVVFITGGARGIGLAAARRLHAAGARPALIDVDEALAKSEAETLGDDALGVGADVTDAAQLDTAVAQTLSRFGRIDTVVANAGIAPPVDTVRTGDPAAFDRVLDVNLHGVVRTVRATLPALEETRGYLLVVSSLYAVMNGVLSAPYATSKAGVEAFGRALRVELAGTGIDVGVAYFGFIDTKLVRDAFEKPGIPELRAALKPRFLSNPVPVDRAGRAMAEGIRRRAVRVTAPGWVRATLPLRGLLHYLDAQFARDKGVRAAVEAAESAATRG
jgi:NAD(P)-dependent dehydrogenase (short-subunit alcohol dehydrogenase family)